MMHTSCRGSYEKQIIKHLTFSLHVSGLCIDPCQRLGPIVRSRCVVHLSRLQLESVQRVDHIEPQQTRNLTSCAASRSSSCRALNSQSHSYSCTRFFCLATSLNGG
ncbi:hypothetical protein F441_20026 [Phytophthora nicotianae CJ01A1]|uniref:Uncharacterized protein n=3 Tax=Phytophthora nicotianae TaxID=4792 RepID=W2K4V3_PHYNI|nr:hypothetical protein L915_19605 [Phytophthora nicotianae]ETL26904.1 hypothetical protein L916_19495 [Phytophthora nicotianae]ETL80142.1 hypothetical protein L917_19342 [Phytophthora nicotianae]ETO61874.1 hypothetical protein F444_20164 [Phytophthora nicotianae P1976]ETP02960.1 hypothetical protein F441_20026 [Phytophthora nicotianae CJ01A1]